MSAVFFLASCGDDEDTNTIVGAYKLVGLSQSGCPNPAENFDLAFDSSNCDTAGGIEFCEKGTLNFSDSGTFSSTIELESELLGTIFSLNGSGTYIVGGSVATLCSPSCEDFTLSGNKISLVTENDNCFQTIDFSKI